MAWPDDDVEMASTDGMSTSQVDAALKSGGGLLPPLGGGTGDGAEGFGGSQQVLASLVSRRFKVSFQMDTISVKSACILSSLMRRRKGRVV